MNKPTRVGKVDLTIVGKWKLYIGDVNLVKSSHANVFILQSLDPVTLSPAEEARIEITDIVRLKKILGITPDAAINSSGEWELTPKELVEINKICHSRFPLSDRFTVMQAWNELREAPYLIHTGYELALMIEGRKPMAVFSDVYPNIWLEEYLKPFAPFVESGQFVTLSVEYPFSEEDRARSGVSGLLSVYFSTPAEAWRIRAHMLMQHTARLSEWNDGFERLEGSLLGYEDWQNDWWINRRKNIGTTG